jgi:hypothetical protein
VTRPKSAKRHGWASPREIKPKARDRRAVIEALLPERASVKDVIRDLEVNLSIFVGAADQPGRAGRRRLLDELITAAERFEGALMDLDRASYDELVEDTWARLIFPCISKGFCSYKKEGASFWINSPPRVTVPCRPSSRRRSATLHGPHASSASASAARRRAASGRLSTATTR